VFYFKYCNNRDVNKKINKISVYSRTSNFSDYLAAVTITGDRAENLDLCLALVAFSSEGSFTCHTCCDTEPRFMYGLFRKTSTHS
jgi:hypothetical protein